MKRFVVLFSVIIMMMLITPLFMLSGGSSSASAEVSLPIETITVLVPPQVSTDIVKIPGPTVFLPQPTVTATRIIPGPEVTRTIFLDGPTVTKTVVVEKRITEDKTITTSPAPTPSRITDTASVTETPSSRPTQKPSAEPTKGQVRQGPLVKFWDSLPPVAATAGIGLVSFIAVLLALYAGYILGFRDKERDERRFLLSLSDQLFKRGKHE